MIYHITTQTAWAEAQAIGFYEGDTLKTQGFIHCSKANQVLGVANARFGGREDLVLLGIDEAELDAECRYENLEGGMHLFPHIYGALQLTAVQQVFPFPPRADGSFTLPPDVC